MDGISREPERRESLAEYHGPVARDSPEPPRSGSNPAGAKILLILQGFFASSAPLTNICLTA
jgi:hypothetical protein